MVNTFWVYIIPGMISAFNFIVIRTYMVNIPDSVIESARIDGCSKLGILIRILIPQMWPVIATIIIYTFCGVWNDYVVPMTYLWGQEHLYTLSIKLATSFRNEFMVSDWPKIMAAATLLSLPMVIVVFSAQNAFARGIVTTGLKG